MASNLVRTGDGSYTLLYPGLEECYHSRHGALKETEDLYIKGSGILDAYDQEVEFIGVFDVGLGLGYNALKTIESWHESKHPPSLRLWSIEYDRERIEDLVNGNGKWLDTGVNWRSWGQGLKCEDECEDGGRVHKVRFQHPNPECPAHLQWQVWHGDLRVIFMEKAFQESLPKAAFDFIWFDMFSPKNDVTLWSSEIFGQIKKYSKPGGVAMTYSVARVVKDSLHAAGWSYERIVRPEEVGGLGEPEKKRRKRYWLKAINTI